jgi:transcriptional regulator with XRE-family HTH domain
MSERRNVSSSLSAQVIEYLRGRGYSQADIARMLRVSESFISLVKSKDRALTIEHLEVIADALSVPLGALLLAATHPGKDIRDSAKLFELSTRLVDKADRARQSILRGAGSPSR